MKILIVIYDNGSYIHWFPLGAAYIASVLRKVGHKVMVYNKDFYHYPKGHLTRFLDENHFDIVMAGFVAGYWQYREILNIADDINASKDRPFFVLGGHGPSPVPEFFIEKTKADAVVIGDAEETLAKVGDLSGISGIAYKDNGKVIINPRRPAPDIDSLPFPAWDMFPMNYYALIREPHIRNDQRCFPVITARGCPFKCNFCYRMEPGVRLRSVELVKEEIRRLKQYFGITYVAFHDELFMVSSKRAIEISEAIADFKINWSCFGRLNFATKETIRTMKRAGCVFIGYGIESMDDDVLKNMNKKLTVDQIEKGIETTISEGVSPGFNIIWGNIGDTENSLRKGVDFLLKHNDHSQLRTIRPVTPYPGSPLYYKAIEDGLLKGPEDFYAKHVNSDLLTVNFTDLPDSEFYRLLYHANKSLVRDYHDSRMVENMNSLNKLYFKKDVSFRGLRQT